MGEFRIGQKSGYGILIVDEKLKYKGEWQNN